MFGQWDKSWATAEQMIKNAPDNPNGWLLRALVQLNQPRTGLSDTMQYLQKHFADNDEVQGQLKFLREASVSKSQEAASKIGQMH
jgi:hypothetical protein